MERAVEHKPVVAEFQHIAVEHQADVEEAYTALELPLDVLVLRFHPYDARPCSRVVGAGNGHLAHQSVVFYVLHPIGVGGWHQLAQAQRERVCESCLGSLRSAPALQWRVVYPPRRAFALALCRGYGVDVREIACLFAYGHCPEAVPA